MAANQPRWLSPAEALADRRECSKCGAEKPIEDFRADPRYRGGRQRICRVCQRPYQAKHRNTPEFRQKMREARASGELLAQDRKKKLRYVYGISPADYDAMLTQQNRRCAICGKEPDTTPRNPQINRLHVDHDHATGKVRGLLCVKCNLGIGYFGESAPTMEKAMAYLRKHNEGGE